MNAIANSTSLSAARDAGTGSSEQKTLVRASVAASVQSKCFAMRPFDMADTYLPAFEAGVKLGRAAGIMCSVSPK